MKCEYDQSINGFSRKPNGNYEDIDVYIKCAHGMKIFHYGGNILEAYIPTKMRGRNIVRSLQEIDNKLMFDIIESDSEVMFKFKFANCDKIFEFLKPLKSGCSISPFSSKNLPKSDYKIPDEDLVAYKKIIENMPQKSLINITHSSNNFLRNLATKTCSIDDIRNDMRMKGMKAKEYIHSIGKWNDYVKYLEKNLED